MAKGEIARFEQYLLWLRCFKSRLLQMRQNASESGKGLTKRDREVVMAWFCNCLVTNLIAEPSIGCIL